MFGGDFDDDLFGETRERTQQPRLISYNAKICEPGWFNDPGVTDDKRNSDETQNIYRNRADLAYRKLDYKAALEAYSTCLSHVAVGNSASMRNLYDSITRCHLALHQLPEARQAITLVEDLALNFEHKTSLFNLQSKLYTKLCMPKERIAVLSKSLTLHASNPHLWLELAEAYTSCHTPDSKQSTCDSSRDNIKSSEEQNIDAENCDKYPGSGKSSNQTLEGMNSKLDDLCISSDRNPFDSLGVLQNDVTTVSSGMSLQMVVCTCLLRARALLRSVQRNIASFAQEQNASKYKLVEEYIDRLSVPEELYEKCLEYVRIDVFGLEGLYESEGQENESVPAIQTHQGQTPVDKQLEGWSVESFENTWFSWHKTDLKLSNPVS